LDWDLILQGNGTRVRRLYLKADSQTSDILDFNLSVAISTREIIRRAMRPPTILFGGLRRKYYGPTTHVRTDADLVALTFDDGPHPKFTEELLTILASFGAKATFFMIGQNAARYPELVKLVADQGHAIGNHSFSHAAFPKLSSKERRRDIQQCEAVLQPHTAKLFRPPFGAESMLSHRDALDLGYHVVKWNIAADDCEEHSPDWIAQRLMQQIAPGSIVLLHDNVVDNPGSDRTQTLDAVRRVLGNASGRFQFCTVPQLLRAGIPMTTFEDN
jgi:peptidoglycan/xylan/chitin deacetylase (PgdA/CDA1 family)